MRFNSIIATKFLVWLMCLAPLGWLIFDTLNNSLGADPVAQLEHRTGDWALRLLLMTLMITPLRRFTGWNKLIRFRRLLGLFTFFYVTVHLVIYVMIDLDGYWSQIFTEIVKRPYITVGFIAWLLLIPLAITSTKNMMKRLGRRWQQLHRLIYPIALLGCLHYLWLVKSDIREPFVYLVIFTMLMAARINSHAKPTIAPSKLPHQ